MPLWVAWLWGWEREKPLSEEDETDDEEVPLYGAAKKETGRKAWALHPVRVIILIS